MLIVTCAIIRNEEDEVLVVQRGEKTDHPFKWEFPGGKIQKGETGEDCIVREIKEELAIEIVICRRMNPVVYDYGHKQITLIPFICDTLDEIPFLTEHISYKWAPSQDLRKFDFSEADIIVADDYLETCYNGKEKEINDPVTDKMHYNEEDLRSMVGNLMGMKESEWVAESAAENREILKRLIGYSYSEDRKLAFRASWTLSKVYDRHPEILDPYLESLVESLDKLDNESVQRSFLRIISMSDMNNISSEKHGILADHAFRMLKSGFSAIAIKAYSMEIIYRLTNIYPGLANELAATINMLEGEKSAGIVARGRIILKKLTAKK